MDRHLTLRCRRLRLRRLVCLGFLGFINDLSCFLSSVLKVLQNLILQALGDVASLLEPPQGTLIPLDLLGEAYVLVIDLLAKSREHGHGVRVAHDLLKLLLQRLLSILSHLFIPL